VDSSYCSQFSVHIKVHSLSINDLKTVVYSLYLFDFSLFVRTILVIMVQ